MKSEGPWIETRLGQLVYDRFCNILPVTYSLKPSKTDIFRKHPFVAIEFTMTTRLQLTFSSINFVPNVLKSIFDGISKANCVNKRFGAEISGPFRGNNHST